MTTELEKAAKMTTEQIPKGKILKFYKFLNNDHTGICSGKPWPVKNGKTRWLKCEGDLGLCQNGYHGCEEKDLIGWILSNLYVMEARGEILRGADKICCREVRLVKQVKTWNEKTQRLFAADCAEHVLHIFEKKYPDDRRPRNAIEAARKYSRGKASKEELAAAEAAARAAAEDAAWAAAWAAARAAAEAAARAAARAAVEAAGRDAAWAAARAAAEDAAWAAGWAAARDAAEAAAWAAARDAARDVERKWQRKRLMEYLRGKRK